MNQQIANWIDAVPLTNFEQTPHQTRITSVSRKPVTDAFKTSRDPITGEPLQPAPDPDPEALSRARKEETPC